MMEVGMETPDMIAIVIAVYGLGICGRLLAWADRRTRIETAWRRYHHWGGYRLNS